jgi:PAS domain S-box-containing protein
MLASLFEQGFSPHGLCLLWEPGLLWLHAASDMATGLAYFAIPIGLAALVLKRPELLFGWMFWLFALFILACGTTHFMDVWVLWHPAYGVQGLIKAFTALASILTAILLWMIMPRLLVLPTPAQFRQVSNRLSDETIRHERTVEQLRRTEESFRLLVESVQDCAMFMVDRTGHIVSWNAGAQRIEQYEAAEAIGRHFACFYTDDDQADGEPGRALEIAASQGIYQDEGWRVRKDGSRFVAETVINPIRDKSGELTGFAKIIRDITRRKQAEQDLEQARAALAQSQKMEAVGQLTGGIAHDFNNMLAAILGSLDLLEIRQETFSPGANRMLQVIRHAADHGAELTHRLLAFSRKQALVDPNQVESALLNLAVNARDAMVHRGKLTIETGNAFLDDGYARRHGDIAVGQYSFIAVSDTGSGMAPEVLERAFEPFYTTKDVGRGTGLGLSQVYGFVRQSGGHVELYSEVGHGTTVKMYFPRPDAGQEAATTKPGVADGPPPRGSETILVVEDNEDVRTYSTNAARHLGYKVLEAADARSAMVVLGANPDIRLLFTDVGLPGMNGPELAARAKTIRPDLKVVFTSGYPRTAIGNLGLLERGVLFLPKPFLVERFAQMLRSALDAE